MQLQERYHLLVISYTHSKTILMIENKSKNAESCEKILQLLVSQPFLYDFFIENL